MEIGRKKKQHNHHRTSFHNLLPLIYKPLHSYLLSSERDMQRYMIDSYKMITDHTDCAYGALVCFMVTLILSPTFLPLLNSLSLSQKKIDTTLKTCYHCIKDAIPMFLRFIQLKFVHVFICITFHRKKKRLSAKRLWKEPRESADKCIS